jgi:hypothetical protein
MDIINCNHENSDSSDSDDYGYFTAVENKMTKLDSMTEDDIADWFFFSTNKNLSEGLIREFQNVLNWADISRYQKLSEDYKRISRQSRLDIYIEISRII